MKSWICLILLIGGLQVARAQGTPSIRKGTAREVRLTDTNRQVLRTDTGRRVLNTDTSRQVLLTDTGSRKVEIESSFPGGAGAWLQFISTHLVYPKKAAKKNIEGTVIVQFIIDKDGSPIDIRAISGPEPLWQAAIDVVKQSPPWHPAHQNGRIVKSYKKQPFVFKLSDK